MQIPPYVRNNPNFTLLSEYFTPEEVVQIVRSGIPINKPDLVPSLQVPPGAKDCDGIPLIDMDGMGQVGVPYLSPDMMTVLTQGCQCITSPCTCGTSMEPARYNVEVQSVPDTALAWVNDNWLMIAGVLGGLLGLSLLTKQ
jgi:hypothetical protein